MSDMRTRIALALGFVLLLGAGHATADDSTDQLWLARLCVHETTWRGATTNDCGALYQVFRNRVELLGQGNVEAAIARYSRRFYGGTSTRPWAAMLVPGQQENPAGWPTSWPPFQQFHRNWRDVYERVGRLTQGAEPMPCTGYPVHWGAQTGHDRERGLRAIAAGRWREVNCGDVIQSYYELNVEVDPD